MRLFLALPLLGLAACSQLRPATPAQYAEVNAWADAHEPVHLLLDGRPATPARAVRLGSDSTSFYALALARDTRLPTASVRGVEWRDPERGRWLGAAAGAGAGVAVGGLMALPFNTLTGDDPARQHVVRMLGFGLAGALVGGALGMRLGVPTGYRLVR